MRRAAGLKHLYGRWRHRDRWEAELDEELRAYFETVVERKVAAGSTKEEAQRAARIEFEGMEQVKERVREAQSCMAIETAMQDVRYAFRTLRKNPGFAAIAVLVLGLGIGAATAVFSVVNAVLLRPLPYRDPARLVAIADVGREGRTAGTVTLNEVEALRRYSGSIESIGSFVFTALPVSAEGQSRYVVAIGADRELPTTLGVGLASGQSFTYGGSSQKEFSAIISHRLWMDLFHGDAGALGRPITLSGAHYFVAGILAAGFQFPRADASYFAEEPDVVLPVANIVDGWGRDSSQWFAIARLKPGVSLARAQAELNSLISSLTKEEGRSLHLSALNTATTSAVRTPLLLLFGVSLALLAIACTNTMNLLFARATVRGREMAIREATGATRLRLIRQMLMESACLAGLGGTAGLALAWGLARILVRISPAHLPVSGQVGIDWTVFGFVALACAAATLFAGLFPALHASLQRANLLGRLGSRAAGGRGAVWVQRGLSVAQVALGFALLATAALLTRSLAKMSSVDPGFSRDGVIGFELIIPSDRSPQQFSQTIERMLEATRQVPGVLSAGFDTFLPPETRQGSFMPFRIAGAPRPASAPAMANFHVTSEEYFETVGMTLARGREFTSADREGSPPVLIVNEEFARRYFRGGDALGQSVLTPYDPPNAPREIVGVVRDSHDRGLPVAPFATAYFPNRQIGRGYGWIAVRTNVAADKMIPGLRRKAGEVDPATAVTNFTTIAERVTKSLDTPRFYALLAGACGVMAVLFVTSGLYGVVSFSVARRTREIGVRMALGAPRRSILGEVLGQGLAMAAAGVGIGLGLSLAASRVLANLLFHLKPTDAGTLTATAALVAGVTLLASYVPARRASRVDPMVALREE